MGGFFIYNRHADITEQTVADVFAARGLSRRFTINAGDARVIYFPKMRDREPIRAESSGFTALAAGVFSYRGMDRCTGLRRFLDDTLHGGFDPKEVSGAFYVLIAGSDGVRIWCDSGGSYHAFVRMDGHVISSSYLAVLHSMNGDQKLNRTAVLLNLVLGFWPGEMTLSSQIRRVTPDTIRTLRFSFPLIADRFSKPETAAICGGAKTLASHAEMQNTVLTDHIRRYCAMSPGGVYLGISGGYDSRLLALVLLRNAMEVHGFTHWKPGPGTDQAVAEELSRYLKIPLTVIETDRSDPRGGFDLQQVMKQAYHLFDGRTHHAMEYLKYEYTPEYRHRIQRESYPVFSGTGGEIYRNHNYMPRKGRVNLTDWIWYYCADYLSHSSIRCRETRREILETMRDWIVTVLKLNDSNTIHFKDMRRYYTDIWLRDWFGLRHSVENQVSVYIAPFTDPQVTAQAHLSAEWIGWDGDLEAMMIQKLDPDAADIRSSYGYSLSRLPIRQRVRSAIRGSVPPGLKLAAGYIRQAYRSTNPLLNQPDVTADPVLSDAMETLMDLNLPIDLDMLARSREKKVLILSLGYAIRKQVEESTLCC
ncbi:MAG TPA: hypothetical protein PLV45_01420 [bacterium]|nr:hypothetical protein [bacterium]